MAVRLRLTIETGPELADLPKMVPVYLNRERVSQAMRAALDASGVRFTDSSSSD